MKQGVAQKVVAGMLLAAAVVMMIVGCFHSYKVLPKKGDAFADFDMPQFLRLTNRQLVVDATFGGVERLDGDLHCTYDRTKPRGKKACPT